MDKSVVPQRQTEILPNYDVDDFKGVSPNEARFITSYLRTGDSTKSMMECFPDEEDPIVKGKALLKTKRVGELVKKQLNDIVIRELGSKNAVLAETVRLIDYDIRDLYDDNGNPKPLNEIPENIARCITGVEQKVDGDGNVSYKYQLANKTSALNLLFKNMKLYDEKEDNTKTVHNYFVNSKIENMSIAAKNALAEAGVIIDPTDPVKSRSFSDNDFGDIIDGEVVEPSKEN